MLVKWQAFSRCAEWVNFMEKLVGLTTSRFSFNVVERVVKLCHKCSDCCWPVHQAEGFWKWIRLNILWTF